MLDVKLRHAAGIAALCLLMLAGCNPATPTPDPDVTTTPSLLTVNVPTQTELPEGSELLPDQLMLTGGLYLNVLDNCLRFRDHSDVEYTPVWPYLYTPATDPVTGGLMILTAEGELAARTGVEFSITGTEMSADEYETLFDAPLGTECNGPYWIVSQVFNTSPQ